VVHIEGEIIIRRSPEDVFDYVADERNEPRFNAQLLRVEQVTPAPIGLGTRFRAQAEGKRGPVDMMIEFTDFERPRRLASSTQMSSMDVHGMLTFEPVPEGTRMRWEWRLAPRGLLKLATPLIARMGRRQEERIWAGLKRVLEQENG